MATKYQITPSACMTAALLLLLLPLKWLAAAFFAACFHELCHYATLCLCRMRPKKLEIDANGASMEIDTLSYGKELFCALAGPLGSLLLFFVGRLFPRIAICGAFHGLYNLLPLYPLDGGRVLHCGLRLLLPPIVADKVCAAVEIICLGLVCLIAMYGTVCLHLGILPMCFALLLLIKGKKAKFPCKPGPLGVQ